MNKKSDAVLIAGSPARYADIRYAAGFFSFGSAIFLRTGKEQCLVVSPLDIGPARRSVKGTQIISSSDFPVSKNSTSPIGDKILGLLREKHVRAVTVPPYFPVALARKITGSGIGLSIAEGTLFPEREVKTVREIECIRHAQKAAVTAMDAAVAMIAGAGIARDRSLKIGNKPLTAEDVRGRINATVRDFDCVCYGTIAAGGRQAADPHATGWGPFRAGEAIVMDIFPQHVESGYWGDLTRTVVRGTPSPKLQKMYAAVRDAQRTAISKIKAGETVRTIHNTAVSLFKERGFFTGMRRGRQVGFIHGIGHGIGLEIHENPYVGPVETKLQEGNVITIEPGLYYHNWAGIRIEDIVLVTRNGCRILAPYRYPFIV